MKEFMLYVANIGTHDQDWSKEQEQEFLKKCETYIEGLKKAGQLISAQPLDRVGKIIFGPKGQWQEQTIDDSKEIQVGYYHIRATNLDEAVGIAKGNPEFEYDASAKVEIRPIKTEEEATGYVYPTES